MSSNVVLIGFPGCGKTTLGKKLAQIKQLDFIDTDKAIEQKWFQKTNAEIGCRAIYKLLGENKFRCYEREVIQQMIIIKPSVISTGGGIVETLQNKDALKKLGKIFYIKNKPAFLYQRITKKHIPAYLSESDPYASFTELFEKRGALYKEFADVEIDGENQSIKNIVLKIIEEL